MVTDHVIPDLLRRSGEAAAIVSRSLKTWGTSESALAEMVAHRLDALDAQGGNPTIAFLARGIEGLVVRVTAQGRDRSRSARAGRRSKRRNCALILGDLVFGVDDETMESAVLERLRGRGWTPRRRGVADRRPDRRAHRQRRRRERHVPRHDRVVRDRREAYRCSASPPSRS